MAFKRIKRKLYEKYSDDTLLEMWKSGDSFAAEILIQRYYSLAFSFVRKYMNREDSRDHVNDTFASITRLIQQGKEISKFKAYLFFSLKQNFNQHNIKRTRRKEIEAQLPPPALQVNGHHQFETDDLLDQSLNGLTENQRAVFLLYKDGYTYKEIMEQTGLSIIMIRGLLDRGRKSLRLWFRKNN